MAGVPEQQAFAGLRAAVQEQAGRAEQVELARFAAKVVPDTRAGGCQHWVGAIGDDGYGRFQAGTGCAVGPGWRSLRVAIVNPARIRAACDVAPMIIAVPSG